MSLTRSFGVGRANISPHVAVAILLPKAGGFLPEWTRGAGKPEAYPNLQAALTRPIDWH